MEISRKKQDNNAQKNVNNMTLLLTSKNNIVKSVGKPLPITL